jgi:hypothetical protein
MRHAVKIAAVWEFVAKLYLIGGVAHIERREYRTIIVVSLH